MNPISMVWAGDGCNKSHISCPNVAPSHWYVYLDHLTHSVLAFQNMGTLLAEIWVRSNLMNPGKRN